MVALSRARFYAGLSIFGAPMAEPSTGALAVTGVLASVGLGAPA